MFILRVIVLIVFGAISPLAALVEIYCHVDPVIIVSTTITLALLSIYTAVRILSSRTFDNPEDWDYSEGS